MTDLCRAFFSSSFFLIITPKKDNASSALDFRPVSLMRNIMNIFGKLLASRLAPELHSLVSAGWSAFIRRSIHDNFLFVKSVLKKSHQEETFAFVKLDFAMALDLVRWDYPIGVLNGFGFSSKLKDLVSLVLATSYCRVLLNGDPGRLFVHSKGLRQGIP